MGQIFYGALVSSVGIVASLLATTAFALPAEPPRDEGVLGAGLLWVCSWPFSILCAYPVARLHARWLAREPFWLRIGLVPALGLGVGVLALALSSLLLAGLAVLWSRAV